MLYLGLDIHKKYVHAVAVDETGQERSSGRLNNDQTTLQKYVGSLPDRVKIVMEASYGWASVYNALEGHAESIVLSHPKKTKAVKTDKVDATILAQLLGMDFVPTAYIAEKKVRELRHLLRHRAYLVRTRTAFKNRVHAILSLYGIGHGFSDLFGKAGRAFLPGLHLSCIHQLTLEDNLFLIDTLGQRIKRVTKRIDALAEQDQRTVWLDSILGIGPYSAMLILAEIGDIGRFPSPKQLCSYAGLVPPVHQSGDRAQYGQITKEGSRWLRWIMVQAAHQACRKPGRLRRFHERVFEKHGYNTASVALARKMLEIAYHLLTRHECYKDTTITSAA